MATAEPRAFRAEFREAARRHWPELLRHDAMVLVLMSPDRQEASLCRFFLRMAMQRARGLLGAADDDRLGKLARWLDRSEEHTSELQSLMRTSYAVFCLKQK